MSDPMRLLASPEASDFERELLAAWGDEKPSAAARDKTLAALGLGGAATAAAAGSLAPKAVASGWALVAKWIALGAIVLGAGAVGTSMLARHDAEPAAPAPVTLLPAPKVETPAPRVVTPAETTVEIAEAPAPHAQRARVAPPAASSIGEQVAALDRARAALDSGDSARAVRLVDAYEAEWPSGAFVQEAEVVRIESLVREGRAADAERAGKRFLAAYPKSPHDARVRSLLGYSP